MTPYAVITLYPDGRYIVEQKDVREEGTCKRIVIEDSKVKR